MATQDYIPFGEEWQKEMSKHPKSAIIERLASISNKLKETEELLLQAREKLSGTITVRIDQNPNILNSQNSYDTRTEK